MTATTTADKIKATANGKTDERALSAANKTEPAIANDPKAPLILDTEIKQKASDKPTLEHLSPMQAQMDSLERRLLRLERVITGWHDTYQWPLPDGMTSPVTNKQAIAAPGTDKPAAN